MNRTTPAWPPDLHHRLETGGGRDLDRIGRHIGEHGGNAFDRSGGRTGVPADDLDPGGGGLLEQGLLLLAVDADIQDAVGLHCDRLRQGGCVPGHGALAIELAHVPAHRLGRFRGAVARALGAAVALIGRDNDDQLLALRLRTRRRAIPFGHGCRDLLEKGLRLLDIGGIVVGPRQSCAQQ